MAGVRRRGAGGGGAGVGQGKGEERRMKRKRNKKGGEGKGRARRRIVKGKKGRRKENERRRGEKKVEEKEVWCRVGRKGDDMRGKKTWRGRRREGREWEEDKGGRRTNEVKSENGGMGGTERKQEREEILRMGKRSDGEGMEKVRRPEAVFLNFYGAQESIPRYEFRQPM